MVAFINIKENNFLNPKRKLKQKKRGFLGREFKLLEKWLKQALGAFGKGFGLMNKKNKAFWAQKSKKEES